MNDVTDSKSQFQLMNFQFIYRIFDFSISVRSSNDLRQFTPNFPVNRFGCSSLNLLTPFDRFRATNKGPPLCCLSYMHVCSCSLYVMCCVRLYGALAERKKERKKKEKKTQKNTTGTMHLNYIIIYFEQLKNITKIHFFFLTMSKCFFPARTEYCNFVLANSM